MAALNALRTALNRMGLSVEAANYLYDEQAMNTLNEFKILTDNEVTSLVKVVRRPGGMKANPDHPTVAGAPREITNVGLPIPLPAENNLKLMCYYLRYQERTSRVIDEAAVILVNVRALTNHKKWEEDHTDVDKPEINSKDWPHTIEAIEEYLRGCLGVTKIPLAYVIRADVEPKPSADDPANGYATRQDELINRAPIVNNNGAHTATYLQDRARVWELISDITRAHDCWSYVRPAQKTQDGRLAFQGLKGHYLGQNHVDNMSSKAERRLQSNSYYGEKRRWNFEKYVKVHTDQHAVLEGLTQYGYSGIDERSKVRHLISGIKVEKLDSVKTRIMSDAALRNDFLACVNLYQDFIEQNSSDKDVKDVTIAAFTKSGTSDKKRFESRGNNTKVEPDMNVPDRYYNGAEYGTLTQAQKYGLKLKREKRGGNGNIQANKKRSFEGNNKLNFSKRTIKALVSVMNKAKRTDIHESDGSTDEDTEMNSPAKKRKGGNNRTNKALERKRT